MRKNKLQPIDYPGPLNPQSQVRRPEVEFGCILLFLAGQVKGVRLLGGEALVDGCLDGGDAREEMRAVRG